MGNTEQQVIVALATVILTGVSAFLGNRVPKWWSAYQRWHKDRSLLLQEHAAIVEQRDAALRERDELREHLQTAKMGSDLSRDRFDSMQAQIDEMRRDFTTRLDDAVRYIVILTVRIRDGKSGPLPDPPVSISEDVRAEIARIEGSGR